MGTLLILGAGQYGLAAREIAEAMRCFERIEFLDDNSPLAVGKLEALERMDYDAAFVAMGNPELRSKWLERVRKAATLIHPSAVVMPSASLASGCIVEAGAVVSANAQIGCGTIVMANAVVGHDAKIGNVCQLKYGCVIPERCTVPDRTKVECNTVWAD